ncbi:ABC transporter substrate-binding protein [Vibrio sp. E150_011]
MKWTQQFFIYCLLWTATVDADVNPASNSTPYVLFVNPGYEDDSFWYNVINYAQAAATDLNINLEVVHGNRSPLLAQQRLSQKISQGATPDYIILVNEAQTGRKLLESLTDVSSHALFVVNNLNPTDLVEVQLEPHWQQHLLPGVFANNFRIGYLTAKALYDKGEQRGGDVLLFSSDTTPASTMREAGAVSFFTQVDGLNVVQHTYAKWDENTAYGEAKRLLSLHPNIRYAWTANDQMAFGIQRALDEREETIAGRDDVLISTINTSEKVLSQLKEGQIAVLGGGDFTALGLALIKIHHHKNGVEWPQRTRFTLFNLIDEPSALYTDLYEKRWAEIDFKGIDLNNNPVNPFIQISIDQ